MCFRVLHGLDGLLQSAMTQFLELSLNHEPFLADMQSLICELHIYDGQTASVIQNSDATNLQLSKPPSTNKP
jgi:hypothetical protein